MGIVNLLLQFACDVLLIGRLAGHSRLLGLAFFVVLTGFDQFELGYLGNRREISEVSRIIPDEISWSH